MSAITYYHEGVEYQSLEEAKAEKEKQEAAKIIDEIGRADFALVGLKTLEDDTDKINLLLRWANEYSALTSKLIKITEK